MNFIQALQKAEVAGHLTSHQKKQKTKGSSLNICAIYFVHCFLSLFSSCAFLTQVIDQEEAGRLLAAEAICCFFLQICLV